jgi:hypothetical protein
MSSTITIKVILEFHPANGALAMILRSIAVLAFCLTLTSCDDVKNSRESKVVTNSGAVPVEVAEWRDYLLRMSTKRGSADNFDELNAQMEELAILRDRAMATSNQQIKESGNYRKLERAHAMIRRGVDLWADAVDPSEMEEFQHLQDLLGQAEAMVERQKQFQEHRERMRAIDPNYAGSPRELEAISEEWRRVLTS